LRRPRWERLQDRGIEMQIHGTITGDLLRSMVDQVSPDTERNLDQCEILERAILDLLAARTGYSSSRDPGLCARVASGVGFSA
jgi:hypothetical protein